MRINLIFLKRVRAPIYANYELDTSSRPTTHSGGAGVARVLWTW